MTLKSYILIPALALALPMAAAAQMLDPIKMGQAKTRKEAGDIEGALAIYKDLYLNHGANAQLNYNMAECQLMLKHGSDALSYIDKARENDPNVHKDLEYSAALAYRMLGKQREAIERLNAYLANEKLKADDIAKGSTLKAQCEFTIASMANPVNVTIRTAGPGINTAEHHEYRPSLTADGKLMVFTSRRPVEDNPPREPGDNDFFEKVFITYWSDSLNDWAPAEPIPGSINAKGRHDASLSISPDGRQLFLYRNEGGGDIFTSRTRMNKGAQEAIEAGSPDRYRLISMNKWGSAITLGKPVNTSYFETSASLSADGNTLYFISERPKGGKGSGDIWVSTRISSKEWTTPVNLALLNSEEDEKSVFIHPDGKTLFFSSQGHKGMGGYDIFKSVMKADGSWGEPENLGYPINTPGDEFDFILATDGGTGYYCSTAEGGKSDILRIDLSNYNVMSEGRLADQKSGLGIIRGNISNTSGTGVSTKVVLLAPNGGAKVAETLSDEDGEYFLAVPGGREYQLLINSKGYKEFSQTVRVPLDAAKGTSALDFNVRLEGK